MNVELELGIKSQLNEMNQLVTQNENIENFIKSLEKNILESEKDYENCEDCKDYEDCEYQETQQSNATMLDILYVLHKCDDDCETIYVKRKCNRDDCDSDDKSEDKCVTRYQFTSEPNPDYNRETGRCNKYNLQEETIIFIKNFLSGSEVLYEPNKIVINEPTVAIRFDYPLSKAVVIEYAATNGIGFTSHELIKNICETYKQIYDEEEKTNMSNYLYYLSECSKCSDVTISKNEKIIGSCRASHQCINLDTMVILLPCGHTMHLECADSEFKEKKQCRVCCTECEGIRPEYATYCCKCRDNEIDISRHAYQSLGKILPVEHRQQYRSTKNTRCTLTNRETSFGKYGIYGHDISDLVIEIIYYNATINTVSMFIGS
jgi:hypothetical protein